MSPTTKLQQWYQLVDAIIIDSNENGEGIDGGGYIHPNLILRDINYHNNNSSSSSGSSSGSSSSSSSNNNNSKDDAMTMNTKNRTLSSSSSSSNRQAPTTTTTTVNDDAFVGSSDCINRGIFCCCQSEATTTTTTTATSRVNTTTTTTTTPDAADTTNVDRNNDDKSNTPIIQKGELLLRIPESKTIHGRKYPSFYYRSSSLSVSSSPPPQIIKSTTTTNDDSQNHSQQQQEQDAEQERRRQADINEQQHHLVHEIRKDEITAPPIKRSVSSWLRCLASYYDAYGNSLIPIQQPTQQPTTTTTTTTTWNNDVDNEEVNDTVQQPKHEQHQIINPSLVQTYMNSLPKSYETIWNWSDTELIEYLSGTTVPTISQFAATTTTTTCSTNNTTTNTTNTSCWKNDPIIVNERYRTQIRPYLQQIIPLSFHRIIQSFSTTVSNNKQCSNNNNNDDGNKAIEEFELRFFQIACQVLSTRCFHLKDHEVDVGSTTQCSDTKINNHDDAIVIDDKTTTGDNNDSLTTSRTTDHYYDGPFLLPVIDLLNHTSDPTKKCTTLHRIVPSNKPAEPSTTTTTTSTTETSTTSSIKHYAESYFIMVAERDIYNNEEILHSYGTELHSNQFLQTFGFIPYEYIIRSSQSNLPSLSTIVTTIESTLVTNNTTNDNTIAIEQSTQSSAAVGLLPYHHLPRIPIVISKHEIIQVCIDYVKSGIPQHLQQQIQQEYGQSSMYETWDVVSIDSSRIQHVISIPDTILLSSQPSPSQSSLLSSVYQLNYYLLPDELVTLCCILVLPEYAIQELMDGDLVNATILQDYYLGHLVYGILLHYIRRKLEMYHPISLNTIQDLLNIPVPNLIAEESTNLDPDVVLLKKLVQVQDDPKIDTESTSLFERELLNTKRNRLVYGLTIRIEEKENWIRLCNDVIDKLLSLRTEEAEEEEDTTTRTDEESNNERNNKRGRYQF